MLYTNIMKHTLSATEARNNFFAILNAVIFKGEEFIIVKRNAGRVRIIPYKREYLNPKKLK